jgi:hypothetical protein
MSRRLSAISRVKLLRNGMILAFAVLMLLFCGCSLLGPDKKNCPYVDQNFSVNLIKPGKGFPQRCVKDQLTPAQTKVIEEFGPPSYIRIWWDRYGRIKRAMEVHRKIDLGEYAQLPKTWLYENEGVEIYFSDSEHYRASPIEHKMQILMQFGDPDNVFVSTHNGVFRERWQYYTYGVTFKFNEEGKIVEKDVYQGTGTWINN